MHNSINQGLLFPFPIIYKKVRLLQKTIEKRTYLLYQEQHVGVKLFTEASALFLLSRFPDSWFYALPFLLILFRTMDLYGMLPIYSDRIVQASHLIPFCSHFKHRTLNSLMELYKCILLSLQKNVKLYSFPSLNQLSMHKKSYAMITCTS